MPKGDSFDIASDGFVYPIDSGLLSTFGEFSTTGGGDPPRHELAMVRISPLKELLEEE